MLAVPTPAKAAAVADNPRWVTSVVLRALVGLAPKSGDQFATEALAQATPNLGAVRRQRAVKKLLDLGFIAYRRKLAGTVTRSIYTVTADGAAAIQSAAQGAMLMAGQRSPRPVAAGSLRARLWHLVRIRKVIMADEAVQLLADAGDPAYVSKRNKANECLRAWAANGVLQLGAKRGPRGQKQYVLVADPGPAVPTLARGAA